MWMLGTNPGLVQEQQFNHWVISPAPNRLAFTSHGCHTQLCDRNIKRTGFKVGIELSPAQSCLLAGSSSPQACGLHSCLLPLPGHFHHRREEQRSHPGLGSLSPVPLPGMVLEPVSVQAGSQLKCQCHIWSVSRLCSLPTGHMDSDTQYGARPGCLCWPALDVLIGEEQGWY